MTTKQYLDQIKKYDKRVKNKITEIYQLETLATSITASNQSERVQTSKNVDKMGSIVSEIADLKKETEKIIRNYIKKRREIISTIEKLENENYYNIIFGKYVEYKTYSDISKDIGYSISHIKRMHKKAIEEIRKIKNFQS